MNRILKIGMDVHTTNFTLCLFEPSLNGDAKVHQISDVKPKVSYIIDVIERFKKREVQYGDKKKNI